MRLYFVKKHSLFKSQKLIIKHPSITLRDYVTGKDIDPYVELICTHCEFYTEGEDEELECAGYQILKSMLDAGTIAPEDVKNVFN